MKKFDPVRKIKPTYLSLTGEVPGKADDEMQAFESSLERDFYTLLRFDLDVANFWIQPMTIEYDDDNGKTHGYTPDVFVRHRDDLVPAKRHLLCEVKPRDILRKKWYEFKPGFSAANIHARQQGWRFRIMTEREIRTPYLKNARFLLRYRELDPNDPNIPLLLETLGKLEQRTPRDLMDSISTDRFEQARIVPFLWNLVSRKLVGVDLTRLLTMSSELWLLDD